MVKGKQIGIELYQELQAKHSDLAVMLKAETARRIEAEKVVDVAINIFGSPSAIEYRKTYPKESA